MQCDVRYRVYKGRCQNNTNIDLRCGPKCNADELKAYVCTVTNI
jgi:hypothetical protein